MSASQGDPVVPPPTRPRNRTATATAPVEAEPAAPRREVARTSAPAQSPNSEGLLASMLASGSPPQTADDATGHIPGQPRTAYGAFMGIRRTVDPELDLAPSSPRLPRYVLAAITLIRNATGKPQQLIVAQALTGLVPIPGEILDAAFLELYGYPRPQPEES